MAAGDPSDFAPISPNPYIVGNPVRERSMFFGREAEFELVRKRFQHSAVGGLLVFCGERRSGKTSILFQILDGRLGHDFVPVLIDMQSMAIDSEADFLGKLSAEVKQALGGSGQELALPDFRPGTNHAATFQGFIERVLLVNPGRKLILLFDEYELFENKIEAGVLSEDVLHILSGLMESHSVFLIFTGSQHLEARRQEYWRILGKSLYRRISYLHREDALRLITRPVAGQLDYDEDALAAICRLTAGQPFYTQAICQSLVDVVNERHDRHATRALVEEVVAGMVENPLPQMIFLWDTLERDEKLVLALLAEALEGESDSAAAAVLSRMSRQRQYPIELGRARLATVLEKLFRSEFLSRNDTTHPPTYCFRMDLWRRWIRRMHSVWQVVREEGLSLRRTSVLRSKAGLAAAAAVVLLVAVGAGLGWRSLRRPGDRPAGTPPGGPAAARLDLDVLPAGATVHIGDRPVGTGGYHDRIEPDVPQRVRVTAPGHAETTFAVRVAAGGREARQVRLRPYLGGLRIETLPPGATVTVDGRPVGRSPAVVRGLSAAVPHEVTASLAGRGRASREVTLEPERETALSLTLSPDQATVLVTSDPPGAQVLLDGAARGTTPFTLTGIPAGAHRLEARKEDHAPADSALEISAGTGQVHLVLRPAASGVLVIQGDRPAQIYLDDALVVENVQNSGPRALRPGTHHVRVVLLSGEVVEQAVAVRSAEHVVFDYSRNTVERRPGGSR